MMRFTSVRNGKQAAQNHQRAFRLVTAAALLGLSCASQAFAAAVPWHADLAEAQRASERSRRPVLAIFTASWTTAATALDSPMLSSDEAAALIATCFEPVCVDVDSDPEATRRLGVTKVPTACVLTCDSQVVSRFELPGTPAEFVAAAARAAQDAAFVAAQSQSLPRSVAVELEQSAARRPTTDLPVAGSAFGGTATRDLHSAALGHSQGVAPPGGRAITAVAAKVRMLSDFASVDALPAPTGDTIAASFRDATPQLPAPATPPAAATTSVEAGQTSTPAPAVAPPRAALVSEALAGTTPAGPLDIDPTTPPAMPATSAPWLGATAADPVVTPNQMAQATQPQPAAAATAAAPKVIEPQAAGAETAAAAPTKPEAPTTTFGPAAMLAALQKPFTKLVRPAGPKDEQPKASPAPGNPVDATASAPAEPDPYGSMPVGLEGYCPVTLAERGLWVEGRAQWGVRHRGRTYLFASEQQLKAFLADPDRYAPALSGDDPVLAFDAGKSTPGQRRYGVTYQSRMYLFSSSETRDAFAANPQRYTTGISVAENRGSSGAAGAAVIR